LFFTLYCIYYDTTLLIYKTQGLPVDDDGTSLMKEIRVMIHLYRRAMDA